MRGILVLLVVIVVGAALALAWPRLEGEPPSIDAPESIVLGAAPRSIGVVWRDGRSGLRSIDAAIELPAAPGDGGADTGAPKAQRRPLLELRFPGSALAGPVEPVREHGATLELDAKALGLADGEAQLVLRARDWSWRDGFAGNPEVVRVALRIDTQPPHVAAASGLTYVRRGGAAAAVYRAGADAARHGVRVADDLFTGVPGSGEQRVAVFAVAVEAPSDPRIRVVAVDDAGNEASARFDARLQERPFPVSTIALSDSFLANVSAELGRRAGLEGATPAATFEAVNSTLRERSEARIREALPAPGPPRFRGAFEQMRNSFVTSGFGELRHYTYGGRRISSARHYGYDLASTAHAPVTAANDGVVIFAGDNGIYGNLVLVDHGLGITTLYGHLSDFAVEKGESVRKGQVLGRSGATGLAGGDHLHFGVLVGGIYVDPLEWWDPKWVHDHIEVRLAAAGLPAGGAGGDAGATAGDAEPAP